MPRSENVKPDISITTAFELAYDRLTPPIVLAVLQNHIEAILVENGGKGKDAVIGAQAIRKRLAEKGLVARKIGQQLVWDWPTSS
jgi:hypothetical protein